MRVDSRRCHQNSLKYLTLFVSHITNCVFLKVWQCTKVQIRTTINIEVPSSIQATNSVPGSFVLLCRPCAASMISKSSSSWKFEMEIQKTRRKSGNKNTSGMIYEKLYAYHVWNMYIHIFHYKLYDSKNDCEPLTNHWKLKCMYRKRRTEVTLIEFYFCALNISK